MTLPGNRDIEPLMEVLHDFLKYGRGHLGDYFLDCGSEVWQGSWMMFENFGFEVTH